MVLKKNNTEKNSGDLYAHYNPKDYFFLYVLINQTVDYFLSKVH